MIQEELQRLERLANQVTKKLQQAELDNVSLRQERQELMSKLAKMEQSVEYFKNQIKIAKLVDSLPVEEVESADLREKIDIYIKEIDNIIAYLSE